MRCKIIILMMSLLVMTNCQHRVDNTANNNDTITVIRTVRDTIFIEPASLGKACYKDTDTVLVVEIPGVLLAPSQLDSVHTHRVMEESIWKNYIDIPFDFQKNYWPVLYFYTDLSQLPYILLSMTHPNSQRNQALASDFITMCTGAIDDTVLFELGKRIIDILNESEAKRPPLIVKKKNGKEYSMKPHLLEYPDSFMPSPIPDFFRSVPYSLNAIDTLRVKVIAHNDREALQELEKYYHDKGDDKGIAIYYKVLLSYEGNGDLAERFYKVLEPYFNKTPEFKSAVREVLLRAALCDHNERAQELCDSLGISFCDYRLPLPEK